MEHQDANWRGVLGARNRNPNQDLGHFPPIRSQKGLIGVRFLNSSKCDKDRSFVVRIDDHVARLKIRACGKNVVGFLLGTIESFQSCLLRGSHFFVIRRTCDFTH